MNSSRPGFGKSFAKPADSKLFASVDIEAQLRDKGSLALVLRYYNSKEQSEVVTMIEAITRKYSLNSEFQFLFRTLLTEIIDNALRENVFYFLCEEMGRFTEPRLTDETYMPFIEALRTHPPFFELVLSVRESLAWSQDSPLVIQKDWKKCLPEGYKFEFPRDLDLGKIYDLFAAPDDHNVCVSLSSSDNEFSIGVTNKSQLDAISLERIRERVTDVLWQEEETEIKRRKIDSSQGGAGLGSSLMKALLSEQGLNTTAGSLVLLPDPKRSIVSVVLTMDRSEIDRFQRKK